jgi:hypothetical protein
MGNPNGPCPDVTFDSSTNHIYQVGSAAASYDAAGHMTSDGTGLAQRRFLSLRSAKLSGAN